MSSPTDDLLRRAVEHHQAGRLADAEPLYQQILQLEPRNPNALNLLGMVHHAHGRHAHAEELVRRAVDAAPSIPGFHNNLGTVLLAQRRLDLSEQSFRRAIQLQSDYAEAHNNLGAALLGQGKVEDAIRAFARAIELRHAYPSARNNLGNALRARRMYREAANCYRDAILQNPAFADAYANLATALLAMNGPAEALEQCERALALSPNHVGAVFTRGLALEEQGRRDEAIASYRAALAQRPTRALRFQIAALTGEEPFDAAPPEFVASLFDNYAETFDRHLVGALNYRAPQVVAGALIAARGGGSGAGAGAARRADVVDLGCGTGLCGPLLKPFARSLVGVDLSAGMIGQARNRGVYDELFVEELVAFLSARFNAFDAAVAADVLNYFGDLRPVLSAAAQALRPQAVLAMTLEKHDGPGYALNPTRRYAHSMEYVRSAIADCNFEELTAREEVLRTESHRDVAGWLVVLRKR